jgi:hypothetical protein
LSGVGTIPTLESTTGTITNLTSTDGTITSLDGATLRYDEGYIVSGVVTSLSGNTLDYSGIATVGSVSIGVTEVVSSSRQLKNIVSLDAITTSTIESAIANAPNTFTDLVVTGVSTLGVTGITTLNVTGIATFSNVDINGGDIEVSNVDTTDLNVTGIATLGTVQISSGIITASSGIVTYYGDGQYLNLSTNSSTGIGIGTTGGLVGYGITFLDLKGAGVSTTLYDSSVGIATIFFEGGGTGTIGIGSTFPGTPLSSSLPPENGDLFFHIDYGRTFIYYDEVSLGVGSSSFWVDSSPFNVGIITSISGTVSFNDGSSLDPSWYFTDDITTGVFSPVNGELTFVSTGSSVLNINPSGVSVSGVVTSTSSVIGSAVTITSGGLSVSGVVTSTSFVKSGGTSSQFLKADGSVDSNTYLTSETDTLDSVTTRGSTTSNNISVGIATATSFASLGSVGIGTSIIPPAGTGGGGRLKIYYDQSVIIGGYPSILASLEVNQYSSGSFIEYNTNGSSAYAGGMGTSFVIVSSFGPGPSVDKTAEFTPTDVNINKTLTIQQTTEVLNTKTGAASTVTHDFSTGSIWYHSGISTDFTLNLTNVPTTEDRAITVTLFLDQGGTGYYANGLEIGGVTQTIRWANNVTPIPSTNKLDVQSFTLIRVNVGAGVTWNVLGQLINYN